MAGPALSFFIPPMKQDLGIEMMFFGFALSARQLGFALMSPLLGRLTDQFGARPLLLGVGIISAATVYAISFVSEGWHLIVLLSVLGIIGLQGAGGDLYGSVVIAKWFDHTQRGKAMSIAFLGMPIGIFFLMPFTQYCIDLVGWQLTWQWFGVVGGLTIVLSALLIKSPSDSTEINKPGALHNQGQHNWTKAQALAHPAFWKVAISFGFLMFTISCVAMFRVPHFINQGLSADVIALAFSTEAIFSLVTAAIMGMLINRFALHHLTALAFTLPILMLAVTINAHSTAMLYLSIGLFGVGAASNIILQNTIWPAYFGSEHIGAIRGISMPITLAFAVIGAPLAGWVNDTTGSFATIWWIAAASMGISIGLILSTPKPVMR